MHRSSVIKLHKEAAGTMPRLKQAASGAKMHHSLSLLDFASYLFLGVPWPAPIRSYMSQDRTPDLLRLEPSRAHVRPLTSLIPVPCSGYDHLIRSMSLTLKHEEKSVDEREDERHGALYYARCTLSHAALCAVNTLALMRRVLVLANIDASTAVVMPRPLLWFVIRGHRQSITAVVHGPLLSYPTYTAIIHLHRPSAATIIHGPQQSSCNHHSLLPSSIPRCHTCIAGLMLALPGVLSNT
jgi:hypothetical protein